MKPPLPPEDSSPKSRRHLRLVPPLSESNNIQTSEDSTDMIRHTGHAAISFIHEELSDNELEEPEDLTGLLHDLSINEETLISNDSARVSIWIQLAEHADGPLEPATIRSLEPEVVSQIHAHLKGRSSIVMERQGFLSVSFSLEDQSLDTTTKVSEFSDSIMNYLNLSNHAQPVVLVASKYEVQAYAERTIALAHRNLFSGFPPLKPNYEDPVNPWREISRTETPILAVYDSEEKLEEVLITLTQFLRRENIPFEMRRDMGIDKTLDDLKEYPIINDAFVGRVKELRKSRAQTLEATSGIGVPLKYSLDFTKKVWQIINDCKKIATYVQSMR